MTNKKSVKESEKKETKKKVNKKETNIIKDNVNFSLVEVVLIVVITAIVVSITSGIIIYNNYDKIDLAKQETKNELSEFIDNYNKILDNYIEEVDKDELIDAAIAGMYNYLNDGYSMYLDEEDTKTLEEQLNGEYTGIGVEIFTKIENEKQVVEINRVFSNSPAEKAGLKKGDIILKVDDVEITDANDLSNKVKNGNKASYKITFSRNGVEKSVIINRQKVSIDSVSTNTYDSVGYIKIDTFSKITKEQIIKGLKSFDKNVKSLVIDVRGNSGGYLNTAYRVADLFIDKGKVIYQLKDRDNTIKKYYAESNVYKKFNKIVVLIDGESASASEILAISLKESANAKIVGTKSYGKGTVQDTQILSKGSMIKYTTSYWLSPKGNSINEVGIKPDIEVKDVNKQLDEAIKAAK